MTTIATAATATRTARASCDFAALPSLMSLMTGDEKHDHAAESTLDVLWVLYDRVLRVSLDSRSDN
jgi:transketolase